MSTASNGRRKLARALLLYGVIATAAQLVGQAPETELEKGLQLVREGRSQDALAAFDRFKQSFPDDSRGFYSAGMTLVLMNRPQEALAEFDQAIRLDPQNTGYHLTRGTLLAELGKTGDAIEALQVIDHQNLAGALDPEAVWLLSDLYFQTDKLDDSLRVLQHYRELRPDDPRAWLREGQILLLQNRIVESIADFRQVVQVLPDLSGAHHALGLAYWRHGDRAEARSSLQRAVELDPSDSHLIDLGRFLIESGEFQAAVDVLSKGLSGRTSEPALFFEISRAYRRLGDSARAKDYLDRFKSAEAQLKQSKQQVERVQGALRRGQRLLNEGSVREARTLFREAAELDPGNWLAHSYLAKIALSSNQLDQASRHLSRMAEIDPESAEGNFLLASYRYRVKDYPGALSAGLSAREARPDYGELRNLLGNVYLALGRRSEAIEEYRAAVRLEPGRPEFRANLEVAGRKSNH